jgi:hypothetical protein
MERDSGFELDLAISSPAIPAWNMKNSSEAHDVEF